MIIAERPIDLDHPPYVIAELGVNHDGSVERANDLVDAAHAAGADAVKLQIFRSTGLLSRDARLAGYQARSGAQDPRRMLDALELSCAAMAPIVARAHAHGLHAIASVFSPDLVEDAETLPLDAYKTASPDLVNRPLIDALVRTGKPLLVSTGAATLEEIARSVEWLGGHDFLLLHCVSAYPTPDEAAALGGRIALAQRHPEAMGYSDHTQSLDTGAFAVAGGACLLEKHLTWNREAPGPDHAASVEPDGLRQYVHLVHRAWRMRGPIEKRRQDIEEEVRILARQSLTTTRRLPAHHLLGPADLTVKRPGTGLAPARLDEIIGRRLARDVEADVPLREEDLA